MLIYLIILVMNSLFPMEGQVESRDYFLVYLRVNGCYFWFNLLQIFTSLSMLAALYLQYFFLVTIIEIAITFMLALDLLLRYFTEGGKTFSEGWDNRVNFFILGLLALSIGSDLIAPELTHHDGGVMASIFLCARYGLQLSRVCKLIFQSKKQLQLLKEQKITLSQIDEEHQDSFH